MFTPAALDEGTVIAGKLRVMRTLGMGGMGAVYEVEHEFTKHRRALKLLHPEMLAHPIVVARFLREASAAGHIGNPHIVETFDAGTLESGEPYIVMEMLVGETLSAKLERQRRLALGELAEIVRQACDGVQAAHTAGIVHRDLKPENLFLVDRGGKPFVKILDFGISKFDAALTGAGQHGTTKEGSALGTPYYMSPEQVNGDKDIDFRTDIYALGVILYECASGRRPFEADALPKLSVLIHQGNPTPLVERRPDLPPAFADIVHRAMAKERGDRFQSASELGAALASFGAAALDATIPETTAIRLANSSAPPRSAIARSEPPMMPLTEPKAAGPTMGGATRSLTSETVQARKRTTVLVVAALGLVVGGVAAAVYASVGGRHPAAASPPPMVTPMTQEPAPPVVSSTPPTVTIGLAPLPSMSPTASTTSTARTPVVVASAPVTGTLVKPVPQPSTAPASSRGSRADQHGLAPNPFPQ